MIADDSVAAYEAFAELFRRPPYGPRVRSLLERRREMIAWANAVAVNTGPVLRGVPRELSEQRSGGDRAHDGERVRNRTIAAPRRCPQRSRSGRPVHASTPSGPATPTLLPAKKQVEEEPPPKKRGKVRSQRKPPPDEVVERKPPPDQGVPPGAVMEGVGIGIGIGMGGMGGGMGRGGGGRDARRRLRR